MGIVDKAMRDVANMEIGAALFTYPQRYILGAAEGLFGDSVSDDNDEEGEEDEDEKETRAKHSSFTFQAIHRRDYGNLAR